MGNCTGGCDAELLSCSSNEEANLGCEIVLESRGGSPNMGKPQLVEWGEHVPASQISNLTQGGACKLCQRNLSGAITVAMCGHIFHQQCVETWRSNLCPCCQNFIDEPTDDEPTDRLMDSAGTPVLPQGTPVMLQGLTIVPAMNGTYARIINYCEDLGMYTIWHKKSSGLYGVRSKHVVSIMLE